MKLITRVQERTILKRQNEPFWQPWGPWELCEGTEGLTPREMRGLVKEWHSDPDDVINWDRIGTSCTVRTPYSREEYRIVVDGFDVEDYNQRLAE